VKMLLFYIALLGHVMTGRFQATRMNHATVKQSFIHQTLFEKILYPVTGLIFLTGGVEDVGK
jgi:hypothetical protein